MGIYLMIDGTYLAKFHLCLSLIRSGKVDSVLGLIINIRAIVLLSLPNDVLVEEGYPSELICILVRSLQDSQVIRNDGKGSHSS
jgi:hypothetical protein